MPNVYWWKLAFPLTDEQSNSWHSGLAVNFVSDLIFLIFVALLATLWYCRARGSRLNFFGLTRARKMSIYVARVMGTTGSVDDNATFDQAGPATPIAEVLGAEAIRSVFARQNRPFADAGKFSLMSWDDIEVSIQLAPTTGEYDGEGTVITLGGIGYNKVSREIEKVAGSRFRFSREGISLNGEIFSGGETAFIARLKESGSGQRLFWVAGISELSTSLAAFHLARHWRRLQMNFGNEDDFMYVIQFSRPNNAGATVKRAVRI